MELPQMEAKVEHQQEQQPEHVYASPFTEPGANSLREAHLIKVTQAC
jgi:hypothetical protein